MSLIPLNLRALLAAFLTVTMLCGPCLSRIDFAGSGSAGAGPVASYSETQRHGAGQEFAQIAASALSNAHVHEGHHPDPGNPPLSCEELCTNWAVQATHRSWSLALLSVPDLHHQDAELKFAGDGIGSSGLDNGLRNWLPASQRTAKTASLRPFALTSRYRI